VWEGCEPVFIDIEPNGFNIDASKIESAITPDVTGILATHCFGVPCNVAAIQEIARNHNLRVIYDAAHAFGTTVEGKSIFHFGDVSTCSFHATKIFHTIEGGAVFSNDVEVQQRIQYMRNFGHDGPEQFNGVGINGKNSEFHAAMGLVNLRYIENTLDRRRAQCSLYSELLGNIDIVLLDVTDQNWNCAYFPILFNSETECLSVKTKLERADIYPRRYFYPSLNTLNYLELMKCPRSESVAQRILCLPLFHLLRSDEIEYIVNLVKQGLGKAS
jgi:dTDP-4-amino-4,6-dideoxygalactose transaminase